MTNIASSTPSTTVLLIATSQPGQAMTLDDLTWLDTTVQHHDGTIFLQHAHRIAAAFPRPDEALASALSLLRDLPLHVSTTPLRLVLHTGPLNLRAGSQAPTVHAAIRLLNVAHPGQLLLSAAAHALLLPTLPPDACLHDLGCSPLIHRLRSEPIFQLCAPHTHSAFPPLPELAPPSSSSPAPQLVGRETACVEIERLLLSPYVQLLTLTGPGGVGKTCLALSLADQLEGHFLDGVVIVPLAAVRSHDLIPAAITQALATIGIKATPTLDGLCQALATKSLLLVLDNFEHLYSGGPLLATLAKALPSVTMLVTSRVRLQLSCEQEYIVPPLALPAGNDHDYPSIADTPAVQLFVQVARRVHPAFALTPDNAATVAELCTRLDGLPLAIELVALHSDRYAPTALLANLHIHLTAPTTSQLPERQRSLQATLDWSYALLPPPEQALFRWLGVFVGGCSLAAVEAVCGDANLSKADSELQPALDVVEGLSHLIDASMLQQNTNARGEARLTMLEPMREYALLQLVAADEDALLRKRHATYYAARAAALKTGTEQPTDWVPWVATEQSNLLAALDRALAQHDGLMAMQLCAGAWKFWMLRRMEREGLVWCEAALALAESVPPDLLVRVWHGSGVFSGLLQDYVKAEGYFQRALTSAQAQGNLATCACLLNNLAWIALDQQQLAQAKAYYIQSRVVQEQLPRPFASTLNNLATIALEEHDDAQAENLMRQALSLTQVSGDQRIRVFVLANLTYLRLLSSELDTAVLLLIEALRTYQALGGHDDTTRMLWLATACLEANGNVVDAAHLMAATMTLNPPWLQARLPREGTYFTALHKRVHAQLDPTTLAVTSAKGATLSHRGAIAFALNALEQIAILEGAICLV